MRNKLKRRGMPDYKQRPISERYGVAYTGLGPDGQLDVSAPMGMENGKMYHEGEMRGSMPEGSVTLNARTTSMAYPETQADQKKMKMYEKSGNLPGFQTGGSDMTRVIKNPFENRPAGSAVNTQINPATTNTKTAPTFEPVRSSVTTPTQINPATVNFGKGTETKIAPTFEPVKAPETPQVSPVTPVSISGTAADRATPVTETPSAEDIARKAGIDYMTGTLTGENKAATLEGQRAVSDLAARQQQEISAMRQQYTQQGITGPALESLIQQRRGAQETELNNLGASYGIAGMQARERTAESLASQGLAGQQFEQQKQQYGDTEGWRAYEAAIAAGDFNTAAQAYKGVTGNDISMDQMKTYQEYMNKKQEQDIEAGNINIQSARNKLGDEEYDSIQDMINSGSSLSAVNERIRSQGGQELTTEEFQGMLNATPLGERNWGRTMTAANMLLSTPGAANKIAAEALYSEAFPGVDFAGVFDKVAAEEKYEDFANGLSKMAEYVASGLKFEEAYGLLAAGGAANKMGVDASKLRNIYNAMNINAVDAEWDEFENSDFYKGLTTDEQNEQREFFKQKMLGQLDYATLHEYEIYNPDGTLNMTVYGKDSGEADKKAASLGTGYTVKDTNRVKFQVASTLTGGTTSTTGVPVGENKTGQGSEKEVGTVYVDPNDKRVYKVGAGGEIQEQTIDPATEAWSQLGDQVLQAGNEKNPYYNDIMNARAKSIIDGTHPIETKIENTELYDATLKAAEEWTPQIPTGEAVKAAGFVKIKNPPKIGTVINYKGKLYRVNTEPEDVHQGQHFYLTDLGNGEQVTIYTDPAFGIKLM